MEKFAIGENGGDILEDNAGLRKIDDVPDGSTEGGGIHVGASLSSNRKFGKC